MSDKDDEPAIDAATQRRLAVDVFNRVWTLLDKPHRTEAEDAEMAHAAHASCYHWMQVGEPVNRARGEWQISRVYAVLRRPEPALHHAGKVLEICEREGIRDWDLGFAYEALARAHAVAGRKDEARQLVEQAKAVEIAEDEDRELLLNDLETIEL